MKVRIWGARGSIPSPLKPDEVREKIRYAILNLPDIDVKNPAAVETYLDQLSPLHTGTAGGNTTCVEIQTGQETFIIDAGSGLRELGRELMKGPCGRGQGILHLFFTHAHWDHIQGFPFFVPAFIPGNQIFIYSIHDLKSTLVDQQRSPTFPVPFSTMPATMEFIPLQPGQPFSVGDVKINTIETVHPGKAYAYRFEDEYSVFVFASDAEYKQLDEPGYRPYLDFFKEADVLIFDAQYTLPEALQKIDWGHSSALIGADMARLAGVKKLVLFHHDPTYSDAQLLDIQQRTIEYQAQDTSRPPCEVFVAYEGLTFDLTPPEAVTLRYLAEGEAAILTPIGHFDGHKVIGLERQLQYMAETNWPSRLVIDLSQTESLTMAGLTWLILLRKERVETGIALTGLTQPVRQVIELAGFLDYFAIYPTPKAAFATLQANEILNLPGQLIKNRYRIEDKLGESWQGTTFKGTDTRLNRPVAVTVLSASLGEGAIEACLRQARQIINLDHVNIVDVIDCGQEQGLSYIIEEFVKGPSLRQIMTNASGIPLPADQARNISLGIVSALEYTHSRGIIHYNLTPDNILMADTPKLCNFGLGSLRHNHPLLEEPVLLQEAAYLAPEQILSRAPDARTDLYAFGVIMYELFTGQPPFIGSDQTVMEAHLKQSPLPPRIRNPRLARSLEYLLVQLLSKDPNERYATAHQTRQILSNLIIYDEDKSELAALLDRDAKSLVDRAEELQSMQSVWQAVQQSRTPRLLVVQGEMGIGKSRLVAEFLVRHLVNQDFTVVMGRCDEFGAPYTPYAEILTTIFNRGLVTPEAVVNQAGHLIRQIPNLAPILNSPQLTSSGDGSTNSQRAQWHFFETVLLVLAKLGPTALFLEDAAFLDEASIALTRFLIRRGQLPLLIIVAGRDDEGTTVWLDALQSLEKEIITLTPLQASAIKTYLVSLVGGAVSETVVKTVQRRTHGNPYFITEITHHLIELGILYQTEAGSWEYDSQKGTGALPPTLIKLFSERVARLAESRLIEDLTDGARQALAIAALIGSEFDVQTWVTILGGPSQETLALDVLDEALRLRLLRQSGKNRYVFDPIDITDILVSSLTEARQRELHGQIAQVLSQKEDNPVIIAHHYQKADLMTQAAHYLELAGSRSMAANAINEAITYYEQAKALVETEQGYEALGNLYRQKGASAESIQAFRQALTLAQAPDHAANQARILNSLSMVLWMYDYYRDAYQAATNVLQLPAASDIDQANARSNLGMIAWSVGRLIEAEEQCSAAVEKLLEHNDEMSLASAYNRLGLVYFSRGKFPEAKVAFDCSLEIRRRLGDYWGQAYCLNNLGKAVTDQGDFERANSLFTSAQQLFEKIESQDGLMVVATNRGRLLLYQGQPARAMPLFRQALEIAKVIKKRRSYSGLNDIYLLMAQASLKLGDLNEARAMTDKALKLVEAAGNQEFIAIAQATLAQIHAAQGDQAQAETTYQKALTLFERIGSPAGLLRTRLNYTQFLAAQGQDENATLLEQEVRNEASRIGLYL